MPRTERRATTSCTNGGGTRATLEVKERVWHDGNRLRYDESPVVCFEMFYRDGEVFVVKHTPGEEMGEAVYTEILDA